jgi:DNA end-binding protein Ku
MPARPISSATLSFGLVSVPVELYSASESGATISFNWLHKDCGERLKQQYICPKHEKKVEKDEMEKGYEFAKGQYAKFSTDEIKALGMDDKSKSYVTIKEFVPLDQVERIFLDKAYFLGPGKGGDRAYTLLAKALRQTKRAALGQYVARGKQYLVLVRAMGDGMVMEQLHYADEVRSMKEVPLGEADVKDNELQLAIQLINQGATDEFQPAQFEDEVRLRIKALIDRKVSEGTEITAAPSEAPETQILDLMEALRRSVGKKGQGKASAPAKKGAKKATRAEAKPRPAAKRKAG